MAQQRETTAAFGATRPPPRVFVNSPSVQVIDLLHTGPHSLDEGSGPRSGDAEDATSVPGFVGHDLLPEPLDSAVFPYHIDGPPLFDNPFGSSLHPEPHASFSLFPLASPGGVAGPHVDFRGAVWTSSDLGPGHWAGLEASAPESLFDTTTSGPSLTLPASDDSLSQEEAVDSPARAAYSRRRPFYCERGCSHVARSGKDLLRHYKTRAHSSRGEQPEYSCRCKFGQNRKDLHRRHLNTCRKQYNVDGFYECICGLHPTPDRDDHQDHIQTCGLLRRGRRRASQPEVDQTDVDMADAACY